MGRAMFPAVKIRAVAPTDCSEPLVLPTGTGATGQWAGGYKVPSRSAVFMLEAEIRLSTGSG
jgi:hypothetical protein